MSMGEGTGTAFKTGRGRDWPSIRQFSVFLENRVGQLSELIRHFRNTKIKVVALSIVDSVECAIVRMVLSHPEQGREILQRAGRAVSEADLIGVEFPQSDQPLLEVCSALLQGEINIHYAYPFIVQPHGRSAIALYVDDHEAAVELLKRRNLRVLTEADLMVE